MVARSPSAQAPPPVLGAVSHTAVRAANGSMVHANGSMVAHTAVRTAAKAAKAAEAAEGSCAVCA